MNNYASLAISLQSEKEAREVEDEVEELKGEIAAKGTRGVNGKVGIATQHGNAASLELIGLLGQRISELERQSAESKKHDTETFARVFDIMSKTGLIPNERGIMADTVTPLKQRLTYHGEASLPTQTVHTSGTDIRAIQLRDHTQVLNGDDLELEFWHPDFGEQAGDPGALITGDAIKKVFNYALTGEAHSSALSKGTGMRLKYTNANQVNTFLRAPANVATTTVSGNNVNDYYHGMRRFMLEALGTIDADPWRWKVSEYLGTADPVWSIYDTMLFCRVAYVWNEVNWTMETIKWFCDERKRSEIGSYIDSTATSFGTPREIVAEVCRLTTVLIAAARDGSQPDVMKQYTTWVKEHSRSDVDILIGGAISYLTRMQDLIFIGVPNGPVNSTPNATILEIMSLCDICLLPREPTGLLKNVAGIADNKPFDTETETKAWSAMKRFWMGEIISGNLSINFYPPSGNDWSGVEYPSANGTPVNDNPMVGGQWVHTNAAGQSNNTGHDFPSDDYRPSVLPMGTETLEVPWMPVSIKTWFDQTNLLSTTVVAGGAEHGYLRVPFQAIDGDVGTAILNLQVSRFPPNQGGSGPYWENVALEVDSHQFGDVYTLLHNIEMAIEKRPSPECTVRLYPNYSSPSGIEIVSIATGTPSGVQFISCTDPEISAMFSSTVGGSAVQSVMGTGTFVAGSADATYAIPLANTEGIVISAVSQQHNHLGSWIHDDPVKPWANSTVGSTYDENPGVPMLITCFRGTNMATKDDWRENLSFLKTGVDSKHKALEFELYTKAVRFWLDRSLTYNEHEIVGGVTQASYTSRTQTMQHWTNVVDPSSSHGNKHHMRSIYRGFPLAVGHSRGGGGAITVVNEFLKSYNSPVSGQESVGGIRYKYTTTELLALDLVKCYRSILTMTLNPAIFASVITNEELGTRHSYYGKDVHLTGTVLHRQDNTITALAQNDEIRDKNGSLVLPTKLLQHVVFRTSGDVVSIMGMTEKHNIMTGGGEMCDSNLLCIVIPDRGTSDVQPTTTGKMYNLVSKFSRNANISTNMSTIVDLGLLASKTGASHLIHQFSPWKLHGSGTPALLAEPLSDVRNSSNTPGWYFDGLKGDTFDPIGLNGEPFNTTDRHWLADDTLRRIHDLHKKIGRIVFYKTMFMIEKFFSSKHLNAFAEMLSHAAREKSTDYLQDFSPTIKDIFDTIQDTIGQIDLEPLKTLIRETPEVLSRAIARMNLSLRSPQFFAYLNTRGRCLLPELRGLAMNTPKATATTPMSHIFLLDGEKYDIGVTHSMSVEGITVELDDIGDVRANVGVMPQFDELVDNVHGVGLGDVAELKDSIAILTVAQQQSGELSSELLLQQSKLLNMEADTLLTSAEKTNVRGYYKSWDTFASSTESNVEVALQDLGTTEATLMVEVTAIVAEDHFMASALHNLDIVGSMEKSLRIRTAAEVAEAELSTVHSMVSKLGVTAFDWLASPTGFGMVGSMAAVGLGVHDPIEVGMAGATAALGRAMAPRVIDAISYSASAIRTLRSAGLPAAAKEVEIGMRNALRLSLGSDCPAVVAMIGVDSALAEVEDKLFFEMYKAAGVYKDSDKYDPKLSDWAKVHGSAAYGAVVFRNVFETDTRMYAGLTAYNTMTEYVNSLATELTTGEKIEQLEGINDVMDSVASRFSGFTGTGTVEGGSSASARAIATVTNLSTDGGEIVETITGATVESAAVGTGVIATEEAAMETGWAATLATPFGAAFIGGTAFTFLATSMFYWVGLRERETEERHMKNDRPFSASERFNLGHGIVKDGVEDDMSNNMKNVAKHFPRTLIGDLTTKTGVHTNVATYGGHEGSVM